jgi:hypothetical protein
MDSSPVQRCYGAGQPLGTFHLMTVFLLQRRRTFTPKHPARLKSRSPPGGFAFLTADRFSPQLLKGVQVPTDSLTLPPPLTDHSDIASEAAREGDGRELSISRAERLGIQSNMKRAFSSAT